MVMKEILYRLVTIFLNFKTEMFLRGGIKKWKLWVSTCATVEANVTEILTLSMQ